MQDPLKQTNKTIDVSTSGPSFSIILNRHPADVWLLNLGPALSRLPRLPRLLRLPSWRAALRRPPPPRCDRSAGPGPGALDAAGAGGAGKTAGGEHGESGAWEVFLRFSWALRWLDSNVSKRVYLCVEISMNSINK